MEIDGFQAIRHELGSLGSRKRSQRSAIKAKISSAC